MGHLIDETGNVYGKLTVVEQAGRSRKGAVLWRCQCECGNEAVVMGDHLRDGHTRSCGCLRGNKIKDETGNVYGKLTVVAQAGKYRNKVALWRCQCECGNEVVVVGNNLRSGRTISCGCSRIKDEVGNRYGKLVVISGTKERTSDGGVLWICKCDCGKITAVRGTSLRYGDTKSCGCGRRLPTGVAAMRQLMWSYKQGAKRRGLKWALSEEEFLVLTQEPCHYCGGLPSSEVTARHMNGGYVYNGLDRTNNEEGYVRSNVVPCCTKCNRAKHTTSYDDFITWVSAVYNHLVRGEENELENINSTDTARANFNHDDI